MPRDRKLGQGSARSTGADARPDDVHGRQRLDKWLVYARFARTRAAAAELIDGGRVRLDGARVATAARLIAPGDVLTLALPHATRVVRVISLPERRGPFAHARYLYEDVAAEPAAS